jgi:hypothetical protein
MNGRQQNKISTGAMSAAAIYFLIFLCTAGRGRLFGQEATANQNSANNNTALIEELERMKVLLHLGISIMRSAELAFVNHLHEFNAGDDASGVVERLKAKHGL